LSRTERCGSGESSAINRECKPGFVPSAPVAKPADPNRKGAPLVAELSRPVFAEPSAAPAKRNVSLRFDAALLSKVDAAAKRQGITRTAWLHCAAFDALGE
jgi:hypothetical protein